MDEELFAVLTVGGIIAAIVFGIAYVVETASCSAKWSRSGFESDYGVLQGCMIRVEDGKWIPEERYRELDQ